MKVSGAHIEEISAWTNMGYESAEKIRIQTTVEKLAKEGKHVINIIHGNKTMVGGDYAKTITFLWEADDEDPVYKQHIEKEKLIIKQEKEKELKLSLKQKEISDKVKEIEKLRERIQLAKKIQSNIGNEFETYKISKIKAYPVLGIMYFLIIASIFLFIAGVAMIGESGLFFILLSIVCLPLGIWGVKTQSDEAKYKQEEKQKEMKHKVMVAKSDKNNIYELEQQFKKAQAELKDLQSNLYK